MRISLGEEQSLLTNVYVNDFEDNYHRTDDEPTTELERAARKIRRRYKNISEYMGALATYQEYMYLLSLKHGGGQLFKIKLKNELIDDFIPSKPRLKDTARNKYLLKNRIMVSSAKVNKINREQVEETLKLQRETLPSDELLTFDMETTDPLAKKLIKEGLQVRTRLNDFKEIDTLNYLEEYFMNKNRITKIEKEDEDIHMSLTQIASGEYEDAIHDTSDADDVIFYQGNYMNRQTVEDLRVYQDLGDRGWNSLKLMKQKGVSKKVTKIVKNQNKMNKKKSKKDKKGKKKNDDFLVQVMMDNSDHDSFKDYEDEMLNFTAKNIFGN